MRFSTIFVLFWVVGCALAHGHSHNEYESSGEVHEHSHFTAFPEEHHHHHHSHEHHHEHKEKAKKPTKLQAWFYSIGAVFGISIAPCAILFFIPAERAQGPFLKVLLAFGAGGLLGDALLHIIPHSISPHSHNHDEHEHKHEEHHHDHSQGLQVGIFVIMGILAFMIVEQFVRIAKGGHCHSHENGHLVSEEERKMEKPVAKQDIKAAAYLNLVADFVHNLTDGLAIGASFCVGNYVGVVTTFTVLLHELPHEIGDFAILVQSGFSKWKAIRCQLITALGALTGCIFSLLVSNPSEMADSTANSWIMPFTAGGFIYIATVSVIPELLEMEHSGLSKKEQFGQCVLHVMAILSGVGMMYGVSYFE